MTRVVSDQPERAPAFDLELATSIAALPQSPLRFVLIVLGQTGIREFELPTGSCVIGRSASADIQVEAGDSYRVADASTVLVNAFGPSSARVLFTPPIAARVDLRQASWGAALQAAWTWTASGARPPTLRTGRASHL